MVMSIDFEILGMKELKVKFGIQEKSAWVLVKSWKGPWNFFWKRVQTLFYLKFPNVILAPFFFPTLTEVKLGSLAHCSYFIMLTLVSFLTETSALQVANDQSYYFFSSLVKYCLWISGQKWC